MYYSHLFDILVSANTELCNAAREEAIQGRLDQVGVDVVQDALVGQDIEGVSRSGVDNSQPVDLHF